MADRATSSGAMPNAQRRETAPVEPPHIPAGFWLRFIAWVFDATLLGLMVALVGWLVKLVFGFAVVAFVLGLIERGLTGGGGALLALAAVLLGWLGAVVAAWIIGQILGWLYYTLFESSSARATPGKQLLALWVVDVDGQRISFGRATVRYVFRFAAFYPAIVSLFLVLGQLGGTSSAPRIGDAATALGISLLLLPILLFVFYGMAGWTRDKRALHDFASGCYVVRAKELAPGRQFGTIVGILAFFAISQIAMNMMGIYRATDSREDKPVAPTRVEAPVAPAESIRAQAAVAATPAEPQQAADADATPPAAAPGSASPATRSAATSPPAAPGSLDMCEIARAAGVDDLLGGESREMGRQQRDTSCSLIGTRRDPLPMSLEWGFDSAREYPKRVRSTRELPDVTIEDASGIGDQAFRMSRDDGRSLVYFVLSGNKMVVVRLDRVPPGYDSRIRDVIARMVASIP